jgi:DNA-binding NtrC family response regulator
LATLLRDKGYQPVSVPNTREAARALAVPGLDLAVIDLSTAGLDQSLLRQALASGETVQPESLAEVERRHIARTLRFTNGNKRRAAYLLGIARSTLLAKVRKYGLESAASPDGS